MSESAAFPRMLTLGAAASMIGGHVTADVLRGEIKRGRLAGKRIGAKWYVSEASLGAYLSCHDQPREQEVAGSNPVAPTNYFNGLGVYSVSPRNDTRNETLLAVLFCSPYSIAARDHHEPIVELDATTIQFPASGDDARRALPAAAVPSVHVPLRLLGPTQR